MKDPEYSTADTSSICTDLSDGVNMSFLQGIDSGEMSMKHSKSHLYVLVFLISVSVNKYCPSYIFDIPDVAIFLKEATTREL